MKATRYSPRLRAGFSAIFFLLGLVFTVWETGLFWCRLIMAIRSFKDNRF